MNTMYFFFIKKQLNSLDLYTVIDCHNEVMNCAHSPSCVNLQSPMYTTDRVNRVKTSVKHSVNDASICLQ